MIATGLAASASAYQPVTQTFTYTGAEQTFTVPVGVTQIHVLAIGGMGAPGGSPITMGGAARVNVDLSVLPQTILYIEVGGNAATGTQHAFNGGGMSGGIGAGGGGGASDIQTCPIVDACDPHSSGLVVAGGSGGGGGNGGGAGGLGGAGGNAKSNGSPAGTLLGTNPAGGGVHGGLAMGGPGGSPTTFGGGCTGTVSMFGAGGTAGGPSGGYGGTAFANAGAGGGGGGGYFGGGGGGGGGVVTCPGHDPAAAGGGGGGAGASFVSGLDPAQINTATTIDAGGVPKISITYTPVDTTGPEITIDAPVDGAVYEQDAVVNASYSCTDDAGGSGVATCSGTVPDGTPIDTASLGPHTFTVDATDIAGNPSQRTVDYAVALPGADLIDGISGPVKLRKGAVASFKVKAKNTGPADAKHVVVTDRVPRGLKVLGVHTSKFTASCAAPVRAAGTVRCTQSKLPAGQRVVMKVKVKAAKVGTLKQTAKVSSDTQDPDDQDNTASIRTVVRRH